MALEIYTSIQKHLILNETVTQKYSVERLLAQNFINSESGKGAFLLILQVLQTSYFVEHLWMIASQQTFTCLKSTIET